MPDRLSGAILAAGRGERLRPASGDLPKPLVRLGGQPLLFRQIEILSEAKANPIHVIVNSETQHVMQRCGLRMPKRVELMVRDTANSMESLLSLGERIATGFFLLMTVDAVLHGRDIQAFVTDVTKFMANRELGLDGAVGVVKWRGDTNPLFAQIADDGVITAYGQRQSLMVTAGVYLFSTAIFNHAAEARVRGLDAMRRFLAMLLEREMKFKAVEVPQAIDVDDAADLRAAHEMIACRSA